MREWLLKALLPAAVLVALPVGLYLWSFWSDPAPPPEQSTAPPAAVAQEPRLPPECDDFRTLEIIAGLCRRLDATDCFVNRDVWAFIRFQDREKAVRWLAVCGGRLHVSIRDEFTGEQLASWWPFIGYRNDE